MLVPKIAGQVLDIWSNAVLRPLMPANGAAKNGDPAAKSPPAKLPAVPGLAPPARPRTLAGQAVAYWYDRLQRSVLLLDVMRERGNDFIDHSEAGKPPVLTFDYETVLDGRTFERPANYALLKIIPREGMSIDPKLRPYVIVDPRAGHGPGVGGFKEDSQIGMAMRTGHACYLVTFFPEPVKGQTIADVHHVETIFIHKVRELHPEANKPVVIGNCQGGWAVAILCAGSPDVFGPIMLTGAPLSYWAGGEGDSPIRFVGGLMGGTWVASLAGDIGNGWFDGANLVSNFEMMNPGNALWNKHYSLFRKIDTEAKRYLEFEKWWGGFFMTTTEEVRFVTGELFTGNKLSKGTLQQEPGQDPVDLRNIKSPIIVFCSWGDNITPPYQALHWILDTYPTDDDLLANEQTIIYMLHETVGHLGIFVSGDVARKEHAEVIRTLEMVEMLPYGLYEMVIHDNEPGHADDEVIPHRYGVTFKERKLDDIRKMGGTPPDEKPFETAARLSAFNEKLYLRYISPWVRMASNEVFASAMRNTHPGRVRQYMFSDRRNPAMRPVKGLAEAVRKHRRPVSDDNLFVAAEQALSDSIVRWLDLFRDLRDQSQEVAFKMIYEQPLLQRAFGVTDETVGRGDEAERRALMAEKIEALKAAELEGGTLEAFVRICAYLHKGQPAAEERGYRALKQIHHELHEDTVEGLVEFKDAVRKQTFLVRFDEERALETLPALLPDHEHRVATMHAVRRMEKAMGRLDEERETRIRRVEAVLGVLVPAIPDSVPS